jgi:hypothetical protein
LKQKGNEGAALEQKDGSTYEHQQSSFRFRSMYGQSMHDDREWGGMSSRDALHGVGRPREREESSTIDHDRWFNERMN